MTTYVMGAGASRHVGYPFAKSMGDGLFSWMRLHTNSGFYHFRSAAESLTKNFGNADDIEELLTKIDEIISGGADATQERRLARVQLANHDRPALIQATREWFAEIRERPAEAYRLFARRIARPGDAILSFNYDVSLDRELKLAGIWEVGDGYGFPIDGLAMGSRVSLLKLHGSANWWAPIPLWASPRPLIDSSELRFLGYPDETDPRLPAGSTFTAIPPMIMPARCKKFYFETNVGPDWKDFWDLRWASAKLALNKSERVVICGYSIPPFDERACQLLFSTALSARVEVCCGADTARIVEQFRACSRDAFPAHQGTFEGWVNSQAVPAAPTVA